MVGAVLAQSTSWSNAEKAIRALKCAGFLSPKAIRKLDQKSLAKLIKPSGYYNSKALTLRTLMEHVGIRFRDDLDVASRSDAVTLRTELLLVRGIGKETADDILLYAFGKPVFVIDSYTKRLFYRLGLAPENADYELYAELFTNILPSDPDLFGEYHALIVAHASSTCKKTPECVNCCLLDLCPTGATYVTNH